MSSNNLVTQTISLHFTVYTDSVNLGRVICKQFVINCYLTIVCMNQCHLTRINCHFAHNNCHPLLICNYAHSSNVQQLSLFLPLTFTLSPLQGNFSEQRFLEMFASMAAFVVSIFGISDVILRSACTPHTNIQQENNKGMMFVQKHFYPKTQHNVQ